MDEAEAVAVLLVELLVDDVGLEVLDDVEVAEGVEVVDGEGVGGIPPIHPNSVLA